MFDPDLHSEKVELVVPTRRAQVTLSPTSRGFNLEDITVGKAKYGHKVAQCLCKDLKVFVDFGRVYTCCDAHGWVDLGNADRVYAHPARLVAVRS